jgi:anti-sigma regulatory factor (Ser/Thr protein kinase)
MTSDEPAAQASPRRGGTGPWADDPALAAWLAGETEAVGPSVLDQWFDATSLAALRTSTQACAVHAGMPTDRASDIVIALHELAANAVRHGAGSGRLRIWDHVGALYCRVDDDGPAAAVSSAGENQGDAATTSTAGSDGQNLADRWRYQAGHGLWLARQVSDQIMLRSDSCGTRAVIAFGLPGTPA